MKKKRIVLLFMSLFAITPAVLGSTWGAETRAKQGLKSECQQMGPKRMKDDFVGANAVSGVAKPGTKKLVQ